MISEKQSTIALAFFHVVAINLKSFHEAGAKVAEIFRIKKVFSDCFPPDLATPVALVFGG
ncbi:MAG: hypothetical protein CSA36_00535 [Draconibacterium sp.]|nr:MAG: hypothetical protein CSA36_00535 [Draconibacterium sp.]